MEKGYGYDVELFTSIPEPFICPICQGVLNNPVELNCQHFFCYACIVRWFERKCECPCCRRRPNIVIRPVAPIIQNMIGQLMMKCGNMIHGCPATFRLEQYETHRMVCGYRLAKCECEGCSAVVYHKDLPAHTRACRFWKRPCGMGCGARLTRLQLENHNCYRDTKAKYREVVTRLKARITRLRTILKHKKERFCPDVSPSDGSADESSKADEDEDDKVSPPGIKENTSSVCSRSSRRSNTEQDVTGSCLGVRGQNRSASREEVNGARNSVGDEASPSVSPMTRTRATHRHRIRPGIFRQRVIWNPFNLRFGSAYRRIRVRPFCH